MPDSDRNEGEDPEAVTPDMFINVIQGRATPREHEIVRNAFRDPHSELHDWLEGVEDWAQKFFGATDYHGAAGDQMIDLAVARKHREDAVAFLHRKRSEGKLSDEQLSTLLAEGILQSSDDKPPESEEYRRATSKMLELAVKLRPDLTAEIQEITKARGQDKT